MCLSASATPAVVKATAGVKRIDAQLPCTCFNLARCRTAVTINSKAVVALKLFHRRFQRLIVLLFRVSEIIPKIE
jgi:hypothetical protein